MGEAGKEHPRQVNGKSKGTQASKVGAHLKIEKKTVWLKQNK